MGCGGGGYQKGFVGLLGGGGGWFCVPLGMNRTCQAGPILIGASHPMTIIAGPCVLETLEQALQIGRTVHELCTRQGMPYVFKASFDKANRSSIRSPRGPGIETGLKWLATVKAELGVPVTTDIHEAGQAEPVARGGLLFVSSAEAAVWVLRASDGEALEGIGLEGVSAPPLVTASHLFFQSNRGVLQAWRFARADD